LQGKLSHQEFPGYNLFGDIANNKFFLNCPGEIEIWTNEYYYLNFINPELNETITLKATIYYTDMSSFSVNILTLGAVSNYAMHRFPCSVDALGLNIHNPHLDIYKYELWVEHADNTVLCAKKTFRLIEKPLFVKEFVFLNKYGAFENFHTSGKSSEKLITEKTISKHQLAYNYTKQDREFIERLESAYIEIESSTGFITQAQSKYYSQILHSEQVYEIEGGNYVPIIIKENSFDIISESEDLSSIVFSYRKAFDV